MHPTAHLETVIRDLDRHVARDGWAQPPRLFALVVEPEGVSLVEQAWDSDGEDLIADLARITWPEDVSGAAVSVQRVLEPDHDVRVTVAALRNQEVGTAIRYRAHDSEQAVAVGPSLMPRLERAVWDSLQGG